MRKETSKKIETTMKRIAHLGNYKLVLDNAQGVPSIHLMSKDDKSSLFTVKLCNDGAIIQTEKASVGTELGVRNKEGQAEHENAPLSDDIEIPT